MRLMDEYDVAVVVFTRTAGVDRTDAVYHAELAVEKALADARSLSSKDGELRLSVVTPSGKLLGPVVRVGVVREVGHAASTGYLHLMPTFRGTDWQDQGGDGDD